MRVLNIKIFPHHTAKHRSLQTPIAFFVTLTLLLTTFPAALYSQPLSAANGASYDFISNAPSASWYSGAGSLSFPGSESDSNGFACYRNNVQLEDNSIAEKVLETHPQWIAEGWISGRYPQITIPADAELNITVGFIKGADASDGVTFEVLFEEGQTRQTIISQYATCNAKLDSVTQSLDALAGKSGCFILQVKAGKSSGQDWAVWAEAKIDIIPAVLPDLVIEKIECTADNKLKVTVKNSGTGPLPVSWTADADVFFDNIKKGSFSLVNATENINGGIANPGGSSVYIPGWEITSNTNVTVIIDTNNQVDESNEQNNKAEKTLAPNITTTKTTETTKTITTQTTSTSQTTAPTTTQTKTTIPKLQLKIISGPIVTDIGETAATISWETSAQADSLVKYDTFAGKFGLQEKEDKTVTSHSITLTGLTAATSYNFIVYSADATGNRVNSKTLRFTTKTTADKQMPGLLLKLPENLAGEPLITADASDDNDISRVVFYLNGLPLFTDYAAPFEWGCDTSGLPEGINEFGARAYDSNGNYADDIRNGDLQRTFAPQLSPMHIDIWSPEENDGVFMTLLVHYTVTNDYGFKWTYIRTRLDGAVILEYTWRNPITLPETDRVIYDDVELTYGEHVLQISVQDEYGNWGTDSVRFTSLQPPSVTATREVNRIDNYFQVTLSLHNSGEVDAENVEVTDINRGYQCAQGIYMQDATSGYYGWITSGEVINDPDIYWKSTMQFTLPKIEAGQTINIRYYAVPMLVDPLEMVSCLYIGSKLTLDYSHRALFSTVRYTADFYIGWSSSTERNAAFAAADYLMLTCPVNLFDNHDADEVNDLLATTARLAQYRDAVFGYVSPYTVAAGGWNVKALITSGSSWSRRLCSGWAEGTGYLLIIGEMNIIPAFDIPGLHQVAAAAVVHDTDYPYADSFGADNIPELRVGRIIGETAADMEIAVNSSLGVLTGEFDFDHNGNALLVSGPEFTEGFTNNTKRVGGILESQGYTTEYVLGEYYTDAVALLREALVLHGDYTCLGDPGHLTEDGLPCTGTHPPVDLATLRTLISVGTALDIHHDHGFADAYTIFSSFCEAGDARGEDVKSGAFEKDIIYWSGHGGADGWGWVLEDFLDICGSTNLYIGGDDDSTITPIDFGDTRPLVFAASCLTGAYAREARGSIARAFLRYGAGVYIGNVEVMGIGAAEEVSLMFFRDYWTGSYTSAGDAMKNLKDYWARNKYSTRSWDIYEMNLYGDPKFGEP